MSFARRPYHRHVARQRRHRHAAAALEYAILLPLVLLALFAILDLGLAATRYNALAEASRRVARTAIMRGTLCPDVMERLGPAKYVGTAAADNPISREAQGRLPTMSEQDVFVQVIWLDGDNSPRDRVEVRVRYLHDPIVPGISSWGPINLESVSTMRIVN